MIVRINYTGAGGQSEFVDLVEPGQPLEEILQGLARVLESGGLYTVMDNGVHVVSIPGRRIETVKVHW